MITRPSAIAAEDRQYSGAVLRLASCDALALLVFLLALALRLYRIDFQSLWGDETFSLRIAREPYSNLLQALAGSDPHPPLYYGLLHLWRNLAGESGFALRLPSTIFSILAVAAVYALGRHLVNRRAGLAAAVLMAVNPFQVWYAQETRMYAMLVGLTALSTLLFYTALTRGGRYRWIAYAAITLLAIYSHYHALFVVVFENVIAVLWWLRSRRQGRQWLLSQVVLVVSFLPWFYYARTIFRSWVGWAPLVDLPTMFARTFSAQSLGTSFPTDQVLVVSLVLAVWTLAALFVLSRKGCFTGLYLASYAAVPLAGAYLLGQLLGRSMFHERYLIVVSPVFLLLLGYGVGWHGRRWIASTAGVLSVAVVAAISLQSYYFDWHYQKDDLRGLARYISDRARPGDLVVVSIGRQWLYDHYAGDILPVYLIPPDDGPDRAGADVASAVRGYRRLWYLPYAFSDVDNAVDRWLADNAYPAEVRWFNTARAELVGVWADVPPKSVAANFGGQVRLAWFGLPDAPFIPGDVLPLALFWQRLQAPPGELKASLRLLDVRGHIFNQLDRPLGNGIRPSSTWPVDAPVRDNFGLLLPLDAPPGEYRLALRVYDAVSGKDLSLLDARGSPTSASFDLATIRVDIPSSSPAASAQKVSTAANATFGEIARLNGFSLPSGPWQAGSTVVVTLSWQAIHPTQTDYRPVLRLLDSKGAEVARYAGTIAGGQAPTSKWRSDQLVRDLEDWRLPSSTREGRYMVALSLESPEGAALRVNGNASTVPLGTVTVKAAARNFASATPAQHETSFALGDFARLAGYDLSGQELRAGETLHLTLHWQATGETTEDYKVFTHLLSKDERVFGQQDSIPCAGNCPTTGWVPGDTMKDEYSLTVQPDAQPGVYRIEVGMYRPADGKRLAAADAGQAIGDRIILAGVVIR